MNILHIASNYPPYIGGPAASVPYLARELIKKGHSCSVLTKDASGYPSYEIVRGVPVYRSTRIPGYPYNPIVASTKSLAMGLKARKLIENEVDIVHSHDMNVSAAAGLIGTKFKDVKKVVKYSSDLVSDILSSRREKDESFEDFLMSNKPIVKFVRFHQKKVLSSYDKIITPSNYMKNVLLNLGVCETKIRVIYNGVLAYEYPDEKIRGIRDELIGNSEYIVTCACRMEHPKGIEYLIDAFRDMPMNIRLVLIGEGSLKPELEKRAGGCNILFTGKVPHSEIQAYLRASDIFVLPSLYEPSAVVLLDSLAAQTPVIATNVGGTPEMVTDKKTGLLIKPQSSREIGEAIKRLLSDNVLYEKIKENQLVSHEKFLFGNIVEKYIRFYGEVLG